MVRRMGGVPYAVPAVQEVIQPGEAAPFIDALVSGTFSIVVFLTGAGVTALLHEAERCHSLEATLAAAPFHSAWAGLRPALPDGLPAIGRAAPGLLYACGHLRNGILLAPVTARLVTRLLADQDPGMDLSNVSNQRRWTIVGLLFTASVINYLDRAAISFALMGILLVRGCSKGDIFLSAYNDESKAPLLKARGTRHRRSCLAR
jgi:hypothetical protein